MVISVRVCVCMDRKDVSRFRGLEVHKTDRMQCRGWFFV